MKNTFNPVSACTPRWSRFAALRWLLEAGAVMGLLAAFSSPAAGPSGAVMTIAGNGINGFSGDGGPATSAAFGEVEALAVGPNGTIYFADSANYRIRAINPVTGQIQTVAGNGIPDNTGNGGPGTNASISLVTSLAIDRARNVLYLSDIFNGVVRQLNLADGTINVYAGIGIPTFSGDGGPAHLAGLASPWGLAVDAAGKLSIADEYRVRQVDPVSTIITTIAGGPTPRYSPDGNPATNTSFYGITELAANPAGDVFVFEGFSNEPRFVRRIDAVSGLVSTVAGGGTNAPGTGVATNMQFIDMFDIAVSSAGELFIAMNFQLFRVELATGLIAPIAGTGTQGFSGDGGPALSAQFNGLSALALIPGGGILVGDSFNYRLRYIAPDSINLTNDTAQTSFALPWVSSLAGDFIVNNNPALTNIGPASLTNVTGAVSIGGNSRAGMVDLGSLLSAGEVSITDNTNATAISLGSLGSVAGEVTISGNTAAGEVDLGSVTNVGGVVSIGGNRSAGVVDLGSLVTAGEVSITDNTNATVISLGSLGAVAGEVNISGNTAAGEVDLGSVTNIGGVVTIGGNRSAGVVDLNSLTEYGCGTTGLTMTLEGGTVQVTNGLTLCTNATLSGSTTMEGSVTNNGTIEPGSSPGRLHITRHLHLGAQSRLHFEIGGYSDGQFDVIHAGGSAVLGGNVAVSLVDDFKWRMTNMASFTVLTAGTSLSGSFTNVAHGAALTTTDGYARFVMRSASGNRVELTGLQVMDMDGDSMPDWWEDHYGLNKSSGSDAALDGDGDGVSNAAEYAGRTDPTKRDFRLLSIRTETNGVRLVWIGVGGKTYHVQTNGTLTGDFTDTGLSVSVEGTNGFTTNALSSEIVTEGGTRFYRLRVAP